MTRRITATTTPTKIVTLEPSIQSTVYHNYKIWSATEFRLRDGEDANEYVIIPANTIFIMEQSSRFGSYYVSVASGTADIFIQADEK